MFALPAGLGDLAIGATAHGMARRATGGFDKSLLLWHALGPADLVVAVGRGVMTSPGATQVFRTVPTSDAMTAFPLALVPGFLVPLAATLHGLSIGRLLRSVSRGEGEGVMRVAAVPRQ